MLRRGSNVEEDTRPHVLEPIARTRRKTVRGQDYVQLFNERVSRLETTLGEKTATHNHHDHGRHEEDPTTIPTTDPTIKLLTTTLTTEPTTELHTTTTTPNLPITTTLDLPITTTELPIITIKSTTTTITTTDPTVTVPNHPELLPLPPPAKKLKVKNENDASQLKRPM
ncbi:unnamed protein product [Citrullus colocynthis]|uniref:Uncharacterized protein n=1 Tax=Citrullus colocynthis TaxID=252529 RepID=A0ABP0YNA2_9ROSI